MRILCVEPYFGGSHRAFLDGLKKHVTADWTTLTLPARGWKWRLRTAAPHLARQLRDVNSSSFDLVFASSMLALPDFISMAKLQGTPAVTYFHENQFEYPVRHDDKRDLQLAMTNILSAHVATHAVFNSEFNRSTFLQGARKLVKRSPDTSLDWMIDDIERSSVVMPVPIDLMDVGPSAEPRSQHSGPPIICWNHRWEHDKNPKTFFDCLRQLKSEGVEFRVAFLGQPFDGSQEAFKSIAEELTRDRVIQFGPIEGRRDYLSFLGQCNIVVSTAIHEFQGLSVQEAVARGAHPLLPNRLAYPELFPNEVLYDTPAELTNRLRARLLHCPDPDEALVAHATKFTWENARSTIQDFLERVG